MQKEKCNKRLDRLSYCVRKQSKSVRPEQFVNYLKEHYEVLQKLFDGYLTLVHCKTKQIKKKKRRLVQIRKRGRTAIPKQFL